MNEFDKLVEQFRTFPGIGRRQAERFAHFITRQSTSSVKKLSATLLSTKQSAHFCKRCERLTFDVLENNLCSICSSQSRDTGVLMVVEKDVDLNHIEASRIYNGHYFVLGGVLPMHDEEVSSFIRVSEFEKVLTFYLKSGLSEVILALSLTPEGEYTSDFLMKKIKNTNEALSVTLLGRGLSVGSELEYSDKETLRYALSSRK